MTNIYFKFPSLNRTFASPLLLALALGIGLSACSSQIQPPRNAAPYDKAFSANNHSTELQKFMGAVRIVYYTAYYDKYIFPPTTQIRPSQLETESIEKITPPEPMVDSASATATVVFYKHPHIALLSCAHLFDSPDTILTYRANETEAKYIQSIALKRDEQILVPSFKSGNPWLILEQDPQQDIAILGRKLTYRPTAHIDAFAPHLGQSIGRDLTYRPTETIDIFVPNIGQSKALDWGTFIYLLAYPKGVKTISRGIVSQPNKDKQGSFLVDALFNPGSSGGIVLASKDEGARLELVGMAVSVSGYQERVLVPAKDNEIEPAAPFAGEVAISKRTIIDYGITNVVSAEAIIELLAQNRLALLERGYDIDFSAP